jgi:hypothetical protein
VKGHIVATSGQIGTMTIEAVEELPQNISDAQAAAATDATNKANAAQAAAATDATNKANAAEAAAKAVANSKMSPSVTTGDYRWTFSNTNGILMYNGRQSTTPIFKVDSTGLYMDGAIYCSGSKTFSGTITNHGEDSNLVM